MRFFMLFAVALFAFNPVSLVALPLEEVVITASPIPTSLRQIGAAVSVINEEELQLQSFQNLGEVLRSQTAVGVSNQGGAGKVTTLRVRGEEGYRTLFLFDGIELTDPSTPQASTRIEHLGGTTGVERIEILRGPQGFAHGADAGGVINILSKSPEGGTAEFSVESGSFSSRGVSGFAGAGNADIQASIAVNHFTTDGFNARPDDPTEDLDGYRNTTVHAKAAASLTPDWQLTAVARSVDATTQFDYCRADDALTYINDCTEQSRQKAARVALVRDTGKHRSEFAYALTDVVTTAYSADAYSYGNDGAIKKVSYLGAAELNTGLTLVWGGDYKTARHISDVLDERHQTGVFGEFQSAWDERFFLAGGLRWDENNDYGEHTSVRLSPAWVQQWGSRWTVKYRGSFATGFRAPSLYELAFNRGPWAFGDALETRLEEEQSRGYEFGFELYDQQGAKVAIGAFDQKIEDEIYFDSINYGYFQAQGEAHSRGLEFEVEWPLGQFVRVIANYTYNETLTRGAELRLRRPKHLANLTLAAAGFEDRLQLRAHVRGARDSLDLDGEPLDNYALLNLSASLKLLAQLKGYLRVDNALDKHYVEIGSYNPTPRSAYAGLQWAY